MKYIDKDESSFEMVPGSLEDIKYLEAKYPHLMPCPAIRIFAIEPLTDQILRNPYPWCCPNQAL